jgi:hypothetical protein
VGSVEGGMMNGDMDQPTLTGQEGCMNEGWLKRSGTGPDVG